MSYSKRKVKRLYNLDLAPYLIACNRIAKMTVELKRDTLKIKALHRKLLNEANDSKDFMEMVL